MKKNEIKVGGIYMAKVNNKLQKVQVTDITTNYNDRTGYSLKNLETGRETHFRSAAKFHSEVV